MRKDLKNIDLNANSSLDCLIKIAWKFKIWLLLITLFGFFIAISDVFIISQIGHIIDTSISIGSSESLFQYLETSLGLLIFLVLIKIVCLIISSYISTQKIQYIIPSSIRWSIHNAVMNKPLDFFSENSSGKISSKVWQSGQSCTEILQITTRATWVTGIFITSSILVLGNIDLLFSAIICFWIIATIISNKILIPITKNRSSDTAHQANIVNGILSDTYLNVELIKTSDINFSDKNYIFDAFSKFMSKSKRFLDTILISSIMQHLFSFLVYLAMGGVSLHLWKTSQITIGEIVFSFTLILKLDAQIQSSVDTFLSLFRAYGVFKSSYSDILSYVNEKKIIKVENNFHSKLLEVKKLSISHGGKNIIKNINLDVFEGDVVLIEGSNGSGKSTFLKALVNLIDFNLGEIVFSAKINLANEIVYLPQNSPVLNRTLKENLLLINPSVKDDEIIECLKSVSLYDDFRSRCKNDNEVLNLKIDQSGSSISGGQRQRIALARMLLSSPKLILLDEPFSQIDVKSRIYFLDLILSKFPKAGILIVNHDDEVNYKIKRKVNILSGNMGAESKNLIIKDGVC